MEFRFGKASCKLTEHGDGTADLTHVYSQVRGQGQASHLLRLVTDYVDEKDLHVYLRVRGYGGPVNTMLSNQQLVMFYEKFGFRISQDSEHPVMVRPRTKNTLYNEREN